MRLKIHILTLLCVVLATACTDEPRQARTVDKLPSIYPDYIDVTIPAGIAPLNFNARGSADRVDVVIKGEKGGELHANGKWADFDIGNWKSLTEQNVGADLIVTVSMKRKGEWLQYRDFRIHVSQWRLDEWGLTYRRIPPGYEVGGNIGIYQRDIHSFDEFPMLTETGAVGLCFNCHTPNRTDPSMFTMQVRGAGGGTLIQRDGKQTWYNTSTDSTRAAGSYAYWHPEGRYVAYSASAVFQSFFVGTDKPIEVYHRFSNIVLLDTQTDELICDSALMTTDWLEIFPSFSPDGKTLYYSTSQECKVPAEYLKVKCSLCAIPFNAETGEFGHEVDTLLNGTRDDKSYILATPSYDGRWLMYCLCSRSNFPIAQTDADLWLYDLQNSKTWPLTKANSDKSDSYHNWSAGSHWFVFASKREDGMYTRLYFACIDDNGNVSKPFLLPQKNPWDYYHALFDSYNVPDFTKEKVNFNAHEARKNLDSKVRKKVKVRE